MASILSELKDGVLELTLNRPDVLNSFDRAMAQALQVELARAAAGVEIRAVLLTGEVPSDAAKADAERIARAVENVRSVFNELQVSGNTSMQARTNDSVLTSKVKGRFVDSGKFNALHVKVITENGVVYLLGLVKKQEAADATEIARTTGGVRKVVRVFEYLD